MRIKASIPVTLTFRIAAPEVADDFAAALLGQELLKISLTFTRVTPPHEESRIQFTKRDVAKP